MSSAEQGARKASEAPAPLVQRAKSYFMRQTAWFERTRAELVRERQLEPDVLEELTAQQVRRAKEFARLEAEFKVLAAEWARAKDIGQADREVVRTLARRAEALANDLFGEFERARDALHERMGVLKGSRNALQRGRNMLKKYRVYDEPQSGLIDKDA